LSIVHILIRDKGRPIAHALLAADLSRVGRANAGGKEAQP
jgi:hypothetical protein